MPAPTKEQVLVEAQEEEFARHQQHIEDLDREYRDRLVQEQERHSDRMKAIARAYAGERIPGICPYCGMDLRGFHQWEEYEQCPRCRADLSGEEQ